MKYFSLSIFLILNAFVICARADNSVVNMSHYDLMRADFSAMRSEGVRAIIHEATYPRFERDAYYRERHAQAARVGLLWGAYHFGDASDPVRQADHFMNVASAMSPVDPNGVLLVLDFEKNGHYPGSSMRVDQAVTFVERIRSQTGKYPGIYMSEYRIKQMLYGPKATAAQRQILTNCWLWVANYHFEPRNTAPWSGWRMWQYTGDGKCDLRPRSRFPISVANMRRAERNIYHGSDESLAAFWDAHAWRPSDQ